jgi:hypothetical protein
MIDDEPDPRQAQESEEELYERTCELIRWSLYHGMNEDDARLLCYQTGVKYEHVAHH